MLFFCRPRGQTIMRLAAVLQYQKSSVVRLFYWRVASGTGLPHTARCAFRSPWIYLPDIPRHINTKGPLSPSHSGHFLVRKQTSTRNPTRERGFRTLLATKGSVAHRRRDEGSNRCVTPAGEPAHLMVETGVRNRWDDNIIRTICTPQGLFFLTGEA